MGRTSPQRHIRSYAAAALVVLLSSPLRAQQAEVLVDRLVAVVGTTPLLYSDVQQKVKTGPLVVVSEHPATESSSPFEKALQDSINFELVKQRCRELELDVRGEEVEKEINSFLESRSLTKDGLLDYLKQEGKSYTEYRSDFRDQMLVRRFQGRVINSLIKVTDKDVETYFLKKTGTHADLVELTLRQILISVPSGASPDVVQNKEALAQEIHQKLVSGLAFVEAVKVYSDAPDARTNGGLMKGIRLKELHNEIQAAVEPLEAGRFSAPVKTAAGFYIFYVEERKFVGSAEFQKARSQLEFELRNRELLAQTNRWLIEQRQKIKVTLIDE